MDWSNVTWMLEGLAVLAAQWVWDSLRYAVEWAMQPRMLFVWLVSLIVQSIQFKAMQRQINWLVERVKALENKQPRERY
jgi:hypothetical protein